MESWSYDSEGKGLVFTDEMDFPVDAFVRSRKALIGWDLKPSTDFEAVDSMEFMDFGFSDMKKKPFFGNTSTGISDAEFGNDSAKIVVSPACMITPTSYCGEDELGSKHSSSFMESNSQGSSVIDLKLGRLTDGKFIKETSAISSVRPASMAKKAPSPTTSLYSQTPCCQVYGCNKDLSSSKDYYKRNKVCEVHSKTAKVIVNGIEQRFCQQCSRFHLLAEFDDGKRSCRKRLVGHNERRRKFHFNTHSGKSHKLLQSYQGTKFLGTSMPKREAFVIPSILQGDIVYPERFEHANQCQQGKSKEKPVYSPQSAIPVTNDQLLQKTFFHMHGSVKQYIPATFPSATEAFNAYNAASTVKELSVVSCSDCALSLLSAQSQDSSSHATGIQMTRSFINQADHANHNSGESSALCSLEKANGFYLCGMNPVGVGQARPAAVSDDGHTVNIDVQANGYFQDSGLLSARYYLSPENGTSIDLLQLSTHLQRVERQRNSMQVKPENQDLCYFLTT